MSNVVPLVLLVLLKLAYLATGLTLCIVGKRLIDKRRQTTFEGHGSVAKTSFKLVTSSPGLVFLVAGLAVIAATIFQKSQIEDAYRKLSLEATEERLSAPVVSPEEPVPPASTSAPAEPRPSEAKATPTLVEQVRKISFASDTGDRQQIDAELQRAKTLAAEGRINDAAVHLSMAVVADPAALVAITRDPAFSAVLQHPQFEAIARARLLLPQYTTQVPTGTLAPAAERMLSRLNGWAKLRAGQDATVPEAEALARALPATRGVEPKERTSQRLVEMLDKSPQVLIQELNKPVRRWILDDVEILSVLEVEVDRRIRND